LIAELGWRVLGDTSPVRWQDCKQHCNVRQLIARIIPGYDKIGVIDQTQQEFHLTSRTIIRRRFATPSGKSHFRPQALPTPRGDARQLRLMTVRSEGQFNTVVYEEEDIYRGQDRRDVILMNRADIERLGLRVEQRVAVRSSVGVMPNILVREYDIRAGNALMYYPEANVLVPTATDPQSKTPAFKAVLVTVETETAVAEPTARTPLTVVPG
ncbi:MAG: histidine kinase, partial [Planctomycetia bacterium]|nr:histidine kinase [Planctomycetia bacterium]